MWFGFEWTKPRMSIIFISYVPFKKKPNASRSYDRLCVHHKATTLWNSYRTIWDFEFYETIRNNHCFKRLAATIFSVTEAAVFNWLDYWFYDWKLFKVLISLEMKHEIRIAAGIAGQNNFHKHLPLSSDINSIAHAFKSVGWSVRFSSLPILFTVIIIKCEPNLVLHYIHRKRQTLM